MKHPENCLVKKTNNWHFEKHVYEEQVKGLNLNEKDNKKHNIMTEIYNRILINSRFSLCPAGTGPNSIRFWESLAVGAIPILLSDRLDLPKHELWEKAIIRIEEKKLKDISNILSNITNIKENEMRKNCIKIYRCFVNKFIKKI